MSLGIGNVNRIDKSINLAGLTFLLVKLGISCYKLNLDFKGPLRDTKI